VNEILKTSRFEQHAGLAAPSVTVADPAMGTGTFLLGVLRQIAATVQADEGEGSVKGAISASIKRLIGFEIQLGPFAVAQLRVLAEIVDLTGDPPKTPARMFVTNTLGDPDDDEGWIPGMLAPIANSRKEANKIKREEPITVVIGNPPYKEKAKGQGAWIENGNKNEEKIAPALADWMPLDRQWIIPDARVITQPNAELWESRSDQQVYLTAFTRHSPSTGPSITFTGLVPDLHHYKGSFGGRAFPLWRDQQASIPNYPPKLLTFLTQKYGGKVTAEDLIAYIAATASHPKFVERFREDLSTPGLRIPITAEDASFTEAAELGRTIIWLHTFGERMADPKKGRLPQPPRLPSARMPRIPAAGEISQDAAAMPDTIDYDAKNKRLLIGKGYIERVEPSTWSYEVSGKQVLLQWFSYRKLNRERPIMGDRRPPSPLGDVQPDYWLAEYTTELINLLNVLGWLVDLEPVQAKLLEKICSGSTISEEELINSGALAVPIKPKKAAAPKGPELFSI
jgi:hypothetical protein